MKRSLMFTGLPNPYAEGKYGVQDNAKKLLRYAYFHQQLMFIGCAQLPARMDWELKLGIGRHAYEDALAATTLRERIVQLRTTENPLGKSPDPLMELFFEELVHAQSDLEFAILIYEYVKPRLLQMYKAHAQQTQQLVDQPTVRALRSVIWDLEEQTGWGAAMIEHLKSKEALRPEQEAFIQHLNDIVLRAGGFDGEGEKARSYPEPVRGHTPYRLPVQAARDSAMGPAVYYRTSMGIQFDEPNRAEFVDMMRIRQEEMGAAEMVAGVIYTQKGMPWEFYVDLARHMWDEIRHAMFGQAALEAEGYDDWRSRPQFVSDYDLLISKIPSVRYAWLSIGIEEFKMKRPGKVAEFEFCRDVVRHPLMTQFQDYDWADEVVHAQTGRKWTPQIFDEELDEIRQSAAETVSAKREIQEKSKKMGSIRQL